MTDAAPASTPGFPAVSPALRVTKPVRRGTGRALGLVALLLAGSVGTAVIQGAAPAGAVDVSLNVPDTAFTYPSNAIGVSPSGSDTAAGTMAAPYRTLAKAVAVAGTGSTVVLRAGTYRESIPSVYRRLTIQAYPHEQVWMKGSDQVSTFAHRGAAWVASGWSTSFCQDCFDPLAIDPLYPTAGSPDMVFVDGKPITQVTTAAGLVANTFFVDRTAHELLLGSDPGGHLIEGTTRSRALQFNTTGAVGSIVRGIGFSQYSPTWNYDNPAMVVTTSDNITFDSDVFSYSASRGLSLYASGAKVLNSTFAYNGYTGLHGNDAHNTIVTGNRMVHNNARHFSIDNGSANGSAGAKFTGSHGLRITDNLFEANTGTGFWCDLSCYDTQIVRNVMRENVGSGIFYELSSKATIASNVSVRNLRSGLKISGVTDANVWNNTLVDNDIQLGIYEDARSNSDPDDLALGITWDSARIDVHNNVFSAATGTTSPIVHTYDGNSPKKLGAGDYVPTMDSDAYFKTTTPSQAGIAYWVVKTGTSPTYRSLADFKAGAGREGSAVWADALPDGSNPFFTDLRHDIYTARAGSPIQGTGAPLPTAIAAAIGVPAGVAVDRGALRYPTATVVTPPTTTPTTVGGTTSSTTPVTRPTPTTVATTVPPTTTPTTTPATTPPATTVPTTTPVTRPTTTTVPATTPTTAPATTSTTTSPTTTPPTTTPPTTTPPTTTPPVIALGLPQAVFQLTNSGTSDHIYTINVGERDRSALYGYTVAQAYLAWSRPATGLIPVYRLNNTGTRDHVFTTSLSERDTAVRDLDYLNEGVAFYVASAPSLTSSKALFRLYDPATNTHWMTTSVANRDAAVAAGQVYELTVGYVA